METKLRIDVGTNASSGYKSNFVYIYLLAQMQQLRLLYQNLQELDWYNESYKALKAKLQGLKREQLLAIIEQVKMMFEEWEAQKEANIPHYVANIEHAWRSLEETLHEALFRKQIQPIEIKCEAVTLQLRLEQLSSYVDQMAQEQINWN